ncbi:MAG: HAD family hydrolase, partial [Tumebacillaceae bacterium]
MRTEAPLLVVFDIDGTLTASVNVHQIAILRALERFGLQEIDTDWGSYLHFTDSWIFQANFRRAKGRYANEEEFASFEELFEEEYRAASGGAAVDPLPGAVACLEELQERGIPFCFATGSMRSAAEHKLLSFPGIASAPVLATASEGLTREEIV